jgi:hypothetical protein
VPPLRLVRASSFLPVLVVAVRVVRPPRFRPSRGSLCFPVSILRVGKEGDGTAKLPKTRTRGAMCLVVMVWVWVRCARAPGQVGADPTAPSPPATVSTVGGTVGLVVIHEYVPGA